MRYTHIKGEDEWLVIKVGKVGGKYKVWVVERCGCKKTACNWVYKHYGRMVSK